jgi:glucose/arabinose dehydrogenase
MSDSEGSSASRTQPRAKWIAVAAAIAIVGSLVVLWAFVVNGDDEPTSGSPEATGQPSTSPSESPSTSPRSGAPTASGLPALGRPRDLATDLAVPWGVAFLPDGSALVSERTTAEVVRVADGEAAESVGTVPGVTTDGEGGLLGIAVSPDYAENRLVYAYFTTESDNRIVTLKYTSKGLTDPTVILDGIPRAAFHDGGRLLFGPDGMLYATTGDHGVPDLAQDRSSLAGKILRITPDGDVPDDNPFKGSPVWSYGHRNVQGLAFDPDGRLWATEFGDSKADELNLIEPGANYGWPEFVGAGGQDAERQGYTEPKLVWTVEEASPSGLAWLDGVLYMGALRGERLWQIPVSGARVGQPKAALEGALGRIRTVAASPDGDLWLTTSNTDGRTTEVRPDDDRVVAINVH